MTAQFTTDAAGHILCPVCSTVPEQWTRDAIDEFFDYSPGPYVRTRYGGDRWLFEPCGHEWFTSRIPQF